VSPQWLLGAAVSFSSPGWLLGLLLVGVAALAYAWSRSRATRYAVRFPAVSTLKLAAGMESRWRRHLPAALLLAALALLVGALARPHHRVRVPIGRASIMLVTDHSGSMMATDVQPTRLAAAERAARTFIDELPSQVQVGVVTFSDTPDSLQAPTTNHSQVLRVIDAQSAKGATDTGGALQLALNQLRQDPRHPPSAIVLLSDGATTTGPDPVEVATEAGAQKIPVYTVALGNSDATIPNPEGAGPPVPVPPDPELLSRIAEASRAQSFTAQDGDQLRSIYEHLGSRLATVARSHDITATFVIAGLALLMGAALTSSRWRARMP
jgi:Ca-activated chloride channel family protein